MEASIIVWNVRGLGEGSKRGRIKRIINMRKPKVVGLIETKWDQCDIAKNANNSSGGIAIYWDQNHFRATNSSTGTYFLAVDLVDIKSNKDWTLVVVYGPQNRIDKLAFLDKLNNPCQQTTSPACIMGDFNMVHSHDDYKGAQRDVCIMAAFNNFVDSNGLLEMPLGGSRFTWSRGGSSECFSRIDCAFISADFESIYPDCYLIALERIESDHNPLMLNWGCHSRIKRPWRFENMWLEDDRFFEGMN
ncbi:unnamed protein product [Linum trigynum]|uniref:Endonuclease/exonuclease/phosphatase domain-containing protein n=1 Tax=Linum trigynum TaxID=586398 RepID=A0AAV2CK24_9ROSI